MTLICCNSLPRPNMMGDLLVTGRAPSPLTILPTLGPTSRLSPKDSNLTAVSLVQKLATLSPSIVVAWSGPLIIARRVLTDLRDFIDRRENISANNIVEYITSLPYDDWKALSLIGTIVIDEGYAQFFDINSDVRDYKYFGKVLAAGSGKESVFRYLDQLSSHFPVHGQFPLLPLVLTSISSEFESFDNMNFGFGGSYELAAVTDKKIEKIDNLLFAFWFIEKESLLSSKGENIKFTAPTVFIKQFYVDGFLFIARLEMPKKFFQKGKRLFGRSLVGPTFSVAEPPFIRQEKKIAVHAKNINETKVICSYFSIMESQSEAKAGFRFDFFHDSWKDILDVQYDVSTRSFGISWSNHYFERLADEIHRAPVNLPIFDWP